MMGVIFFLIVLTVYGAIHSAFTGDWANIPFWFLITGILAWLLRYTDGRQWP